MYSHFVRNMTCFFNINKEHETPDYRYTLAKELEPLGDVNVFKNLESTNMESYKMLQGIIWAITNNAQRYPSFKSFAWELWGYGFDGVYYPIEANELEEKLKMIDLLLSTQYWH